MKRSIPRSLVEKALEAKAEPMSELETKSATGPLRGAGSAWKAGALAQSQAAVEEARDALADDVLNGRHELMLSPEQISDPLGSDRREDWRDQEAFQTLVESIKDNGQDTPIQVWPEDPDWRPDALEPLEVGGTRFILLTGRRRHAAAEKLGLKLRAILAPPELRRAGHTQFEMLFLRFRENEARENLSAFERLLSVGEMYEELLGAGEKLTAVAFAKRIGVHESIVSRARTVFARRDEILNAFKNAYDMSFRDLQTALASLEKKGKKPVKKAATKLAAKRKIGSRNLSLTHVNGTLSIKAAGVPVDQKQLEELSDLIADYLNNKPKPGAENDPRVRAL